MTNPTFINSGLFHPVSCIMSSSGSIMTSKLSSACSLVSWQPEDEQVPLLVSLWAPHVRQVQGKVERAPGNLSR